MAALLENDLDGYSRFSVPLILARFPDWEPLARVMPRPDGAGGTVEFAVPCPSAAVESGLRISTADEELSVGFHTHHTHFAEHDHRASAEKIQAGLDHAADILSERLGVVSWYCGDALAGSRMVALPHAAPLPGLLDDVRATALAGIVEECDRVTLRSWSGRFDRDEARGRSGAAADRR